MVDILQKRSRLEDDRDIELLALAKKCMNGLVDQLPEPYREAITLSELEGMKQTEMALQLGISHSGAKSRVQRGRKLLKEMMAECCQFTLNEKGQWNNDRWMDCA